MTFKHTLCLSVSSFLLAVGGCAGLDTASSRRAIIDTPCAADTDCPSGYECEIEDEHGTTVSYCQEHGENDGSCPPGYELEVEHGQTYCKPHGGDDGGGDGGGGGSDDPPNDGTIECETDADCGAGLECEVEVEHGVTTAFCKPHGGDDD